MAIEKEGESMSLKETRRTDPELAGLIDEELARQEACVEMIASEVLCRFL